ncbi:MAG: hypothetical protein WA126_13325 [Thermodesulfovibrionales bacterium]
MAWIKAHIGWLSGLVILLLICLFFLYAWFDSRVTITYMLQEHEDRCREIEVLQSLLLETGKQMNRSEIEQIVTKRFGKDYLIKKDEEDELSVDNVILKFKGGSLIKVKSTNSCSG